MWYLHRKSRSKNKQIQTRLGVIIRDVQTNKLFFRCQAVKDTGEICIYIYIYIYIHIGSISSLIHISLNIIDIFCLHIVCWSFRIAVLIRSELVDESSIISYFPNSFCLTLGHHQGRIYYKSEVTFVCTLLLCNKKSVCTVAVCSVYF